MALDNTLTELDLYDAEEQSTVALRNSEHTDRAVIDYDHNIESSFSAGDHIDPCNLKYEGSYDSNLMCPICHLPFFEPVVLKCEHIFCKPCIEQYVAALVSADHEDTSEDIRCPMCRSLVSSEWAAAPRVIKNMCDAITVRCPQDSCMKLVPRAGLAVHLLSHQITVQAGAIQPVHVLCLGAQYGCQADLFEPDYGSHIAGCVYARLTPQLRQQDKTITELKQALVDQTQATRDIKRHLEGLSGLVDVLQPKINSLSDLLDPAVEEIHRPELRTGLTSHHPIVEHDDRMQDASLAVPADHSLSNYVHDHQQLLQLQDTTNTRVNVLEHDMASVKHSLTDLEARFSLTMMNENLRLREEINVMRGSMHRMQVQLQWLINKERIANQRDILIARGRQQIQQDIPIVEGVSREQPDREGHLSGSNSESSSPTFVPSRPVLRRSSAGSSQERVKL